MRDPLLWAVCGKPVIHSRSPDIFNPLFKQLGINAHYVRLAADSAGEALAAADAMALSGLNVTSPFKSDMASLLDDLGPHASALSAVNTVTFQGGISRGFNTDADGVIRALESQGVEIPGKPAAVLGAGGAARAAAYGLLRAGAQRVIVVNRTQGRAQKIARYLGCDWAPVASLPEVLKNSGLLVSCIPSGLSLVDPAWLHRKLVVLDADYRDARLAHAAEQRHCRVVSGLAWLVGQAAPGFRHFTGQEVPPHLRPALLRDLSRTSLAARRSVALIGFMGSGKTTVGKCLAAKLGFEFLDTDDLVEERAGMEIPQIFDDLGEASFRRLEKSVLRTLSDDPVPKVISLGGGAVQDTENRAVLKQSFQTFWLWASPRTALGRINRVTRPLLKDSDGEDLAASLLRERLPGYAESADLVVHTDEHSAADITQRIHDEMDSTL